MIFKAIAELLRYILIQLFGLKALKLQGLTNQNLPLKVVVTLTTTPSRIGGLKPTLISLLNQSIQPDLIILNIPHQYRDQEEYQIPRFLSKFPRLEIVRTDQDFGPATKLLPTLKKDTIADDTLIIIADDDQLYPFKMIETYLSTSRKYPDSTLAFCGWRVPKSARHVDRKAKRGAGVRIFYPFANIFSDTEIDIVQGASTYAVKKKFFDQSVFDYSNAPKEAFFVDDIWFSGHLAMNGIKKMLIHTYLPYMRLESIFTNTKSGLNKTTNSTYTNNDKMYEWFEDYWIKN